MIPRFIEKPDPFIYASDNFVVLDFETTNNEKGSVLADNSIVMGTWYKDGKYTTVEGGELEYAELIEAIEQSDFLVAHNAKFELQWLARCGLDISTVLVYDTMIGEYVIAGNRPARLSLDEMAKAYGVGHKDKFINILMENGVCPSEMPTSLLRKRNVKDVAQTLGIFLKQRDYLFDNDLIQVQFTRCILTPVLADIEQNGMFLDADRVRKAYDEALEELESISAELDEFTGGINLNSPKQVGEFLYDDLKFKEITNSYGKPIRTEAGARRTDAATLAKLNATTKRQRKFVELYTAYNKVEAAVSKNLAFFKGIVEEAGGKFYGVFNQCVTATHRLSSSGRRTYISMFDKHKSVQFQNMPRTMKPLMKARRKGYKIAEADGAQLEFRVAGFIGKDKQVLQDLIDKVDVHAVTAATLTEAGEETTRTEAKSRTFKPLYGGESGTDAEVAYFKEFKRRYKGITETQRRWIQTVVATKQLVTCTGLIFYWPYAKMHPKSGYVEGQQAICNYPVQSLATADIIPIAVTKVWHELKSRGMKTFLTNTVHDSVIAEMAEDEEEEYKDICNKAFTDYVYFYLKEVYNIEFFIPLAVEVKIGDHWGEGEEFTYEATPPYRLEGE